MIQRRQFVRLFLSAITSLSVAARADAAFVLLVTTNSGSLTTMESFRKTQLESMGNTVSTIWDGASQATFTAAYPLYDFIYVSNEVTETDMASKVREAPIAVLSESAVLANEMGFCTTNGTTAASASINITNNTHQITTGFALGACTLGTATYPIVRLEGTTASGATVLATQAGKNSLSVVEVGDVLANTYNGSNLAFGRRLQFPIEMSTANTATFNGNMTLLVNRMFAWLSAQKELRGWWKLDETSGTAANDATFRINNGTITGTSAAATGMRDGARRFAYSDGDDYATIPNSNSLQETQEGSAFSIAAWFQPMSLPPGSGSANNSAYAIVMKEGYPVGLRYSNTGTFVFEHYLTGNISNSVNSGATTYPVGDFQHVVGVVDRAAGTTKIYVNGVLRGTQTFTANTAGRDYGTVPWRLGIQNPSLGTYRWSADGVIDDARIYNYALSAPEVAQVHGLIGHWKFNEGSGTAAADSTAMGTNATLSGGAGWETDCAGNKALVTNGTGGIAQTAATFDPPSEGTVAFWMKPAAGSTLRRVFGNGGDWELRQQADNTLVFDLCGDGATTISTTTVFDDSTRWRHVAETFNSADNTYAIYVDGKLERSGVNSVDMVKQAAGALLFGARTGSTEYWPGSLRDFRLYNRRLNPSEIAQLAGLAGHWKLDETTGSSAADASPWGRAGTVVGTPTWQAGKVNNSLKLNGSTYMAVPGLMNKPKNVTIAAWVNLTAADTGGAEVISLGDSLSIRMNEGSVSRAFYYTGSTWVSATVNQTYGPGWRHFAAVFDDDNDILRFYVNGTQVASTAATASIAYTQGANTQIGRHGNGNTAYDVNGQIDDVRIYERALCPAQITELVNDGGGYFQGVRILQWVESR